MTFEELVKQFRTWYPEYSHLGDVNFLMVVEVKLCKLLRCDDLTPLEKEKLALLKDVREYLT